nr:TIGR02530 family flagellar biosynthesis protein [Ruthenibacterium lactatiformans]
MDTLLIRGRMNFPVTTGNAIVPQQIQPQALQDEKAGSFQKVLEQTVQKQELSFSKHAAERVAERDIELSTSGLERLNEGLKIAREKGLADALIMMDGSAFIISAKNSMVITALKDQELKGRAITNIDGTVIL